MVDIRIEEIFTQRNIEEALDYLSNKRDSCGADGRALSELPHYWEINGGKIRDS